MTPFSWEEGSVGGREELFAGASAGASFQTSLVAEVLAGLYGAGATLAALTVALPHPSGQNELGLLAIIANAYVVGAILHLRAPTLPAWSMPVALAWGSTLITGVAYFSGETPSPLVFFYLWIFLYSSYFFTRRQAARRSRTSGWPTARCWSQGHPAAASSAWWLVGMGTLAGRGVPDHGDACTPSSR